MSHRDDIAPLRVRLTADVDREDTLIGNFTARQLTILGVTGISLWIFWAATNTAIGVSTFLAVAIPVGVAGFSLATVRRDGISLDRWLAAMIAHKRSPRHLAPEVGDLNPPTPKWLATKGETGTRRVAPLRLPAKGVTSQGLIDLGPDGTAALVRCSTVNFALKSNAEQHALVAGYGRWLNSLDAPVQILVRARRMDLAPLAARIDDGAAGLADPQLEAAARYHAGFLRQLSAERELLHREVTVVVRDTRSPAHTWHRATETARHLSACDINTTVLDQDQTLAAWAESVGAPPPPQGQAPVDAIIRAK